MLFERYQNEPYSDWSDPENRKVFKGILADVKKQLGADYPLIIGGERITTGQWITSTDPGDTGQVIGRTAAGKKPEIDAAFNAAQEAFKTWSRLPMAHRARALIKLSAVMRRRKWELAAWEVYEAQKNFLEAEADVAEAIDFCDYYARQALLLEAPLPTYDYPGEENTTTYQAMGVGVVIPPWNFLLAILAGTAVGPVVAGNTVIVKPAPSTPIIAQKFMECVEEAGFPPGVINLLTGEDADLGDALVDDVRTRFINFTGSVATGLRIHERAAKVHEGQRWLKKVFLEMGGKDAMIVDETADLDAAVKAAVAGGFGFQGQKCSAMSRLILVEDIYDEVVERFAAGAQALSVGHAEEDHDVCALISEGQFDKVLSYIDIGRNEGRLVTGGQRVEVEGRTGYYLQPTIFADVAPDARIAQEEIFGPVVTVLKAKDYDHALEIANSTRYALTGGVMSRNRARLERARYEFEAGNLYLNRKITGALVGVQPFGGFNMSGSNAKAGGPDYVRLFMEAKTVTERF